MNSEDGVIKNPTPEQIAASIERRKALDSERVIAIRRASYSHALHLFNLSCMERIEVGRRLERGSYYHFGAFAVSVNWYPIRWYRFLRDRRILRESDPSVPWYALWPSSRWGKRDE